MRTMFCLILLHLYACCITLILVKLVISQARTIVNAFIDEYASYQEDLFSLFPSLHYSTAVIGICFNTFERNFESPIDPLWSLYSRSKQLVSE